jgi:hypothetical protein
MEAMGTRGRQGEQRKCVNTVPVIGGSQGVKALIEGRKPTGETVHVLRLVDHGPGTQGVGGHFLPDTHTLGFELRLVSPWESY